MNDDGSLDKATKVRNTLRRKANTLLNSVLWDKFTNKNNKHRIYDSFIKKNNPIYLRSVACERNNDKHLRRTEMIY